MPATKTRTQEPSKWDNTVLDNVFYFLFESWFHSLSYWSSTFAVFSAQKQTTGLSFLPLPSQKRGSPEGKCNTASSPPQSTSCWKRLQMTWRPVTGWSCQRLGFRLEVKVYLQTKLHSWSSPSTRKMKCPVCAVTFNTNTKISQDETLSFAVTALPTDICFCVK